MKKCLLGIAMLLTASLSFAQDNKFTISPADEELVFNISSLDLNEPTEFTVVMNVNEEYVKRCRTFCIWIKLPDGVEPVKYPDDFLDEEDWPYFILIRNCALDRLKGTLSETYNAENNTLCLIGKHEQNKGGFPIDVTEEIATFQLKATDKMKIGTGNVSVCDKPYVEGYVGEDVRMIITTIDSPSISVYPTATDTPVNLKAKLEMGPSEYATLCWPGALDFAGTGLTAQVGTGIVKGMVQREEVVKVPANTPVILVGAKGPYFLKSAEENGLTAPATNVLKGTADGPYTATNKTFALASKNEGVGFYRCEADVVIPQYKAYIESDSSADESFLFEETTGISSVEAEAGNTDAYTISGVKVKNPTQKGIYIINGKKVVK